MALNPARSRSGAARDAPASRHGAAHAIALFTLAAAIASASCRASSLPPHGEAFFIVDTDLPVPTLAGRLRVDLYAEDGTWFESRDIGRSDPLDWPASFSVYSGDDTRDVRVLVRIRAYPEGVTRAYVGERYAPRATYTEPRVAKGLGDLCANAPDLPIGGRVTARRGSTPFTVFTADAAGSCTPLNVTSSVNARVRCQNATELPVNGHVAGHHRTAGVADLTYYPAPCVPFNNLAGSVAARVTIAKAGVYRFDVANSFPYVADSILFLRTQCDDAASQLACDSETTVPAISSGHFPRFQAQLAPGTYWLMTGGVQANLPADLTLEAFSVDDPQAAGAEAPSAPAAQSPGLPRLHPSDAPTGANATDAGDPTQREEPEPNATVDRLALVRLVPGARGAARITLRGACAGTMAKLGEDPTLPDAKSALTCVDTENASVAVEELVLDPDLSVPTASAHDTFGVGEPCTTDASTTDVACIPGGAFLFGGRGSNPLSDPLFGATPERIARMPKFFLDKYEVTVGQMRAAIAAGLPTDPAALFVNDGPLWSNQTEPAVQTCSYSRVPQGREDLSVSCVAWRLARAYCLLRGGDLPTEAQWEYAASAAGRPFKTLYAWGDATPACNREVFGRGGTAQRGGTDCAAALKVPLGPVAENATGGDVTALGVAALMGGLQEWTKDSAAPYDGECWRAAGLTSPRCFEDDAPFRSIRGASWLDGQIVPATARSAAPGDMPSAGITAQLSPQGTVGFRCAYAEAP